MSDEKEIRIPSIDPPGQPGAQLPQTQGSPQAQPGCLGAAVKIILVLAIGIFVLGGLIFASCFLMMRR